MALQQVHDVVTRQHARRAAEEHLQHVELGRGEVAVLAGLRNEFAPVDVENPAVERQPLSAACTNDGAIAAVGQRLAVSLCAAIVAPEDSAHARQNFPDVERLGDVVVGAEFQPDDAIDRVTFAGDHDDRHVVGRPHGPRDVEAVLTAEVKIQRDQVDGRRLEMRGKPGAIFGFGHAIAFEFKRVAQQRANGDVVVDDENGACSAGLGHGSDKSSWIGAL